MPEKKRKECFVIQPIAKTLNHPKKYWTRHFNTFLKPLVEESGDFEARRSEPLRGDILREIIKYLVRCPVVVADITDDNPNVYWELGVRHSFKNGTVIIAERGTKARFNISTQSVLYYDPKDIYANQDFRTRFKEAITNCLSESDRTDSHVLEAISGRGTLFQIFRREETIRRLDALYYECGGNLALISLIMDYAKENVESTEEGKIVTATLGKAAVELLLTHRYIDNENDFYISATKCLQNINSINQKLVQWHQSDAEGVDKWLLNSKQHMESNFEDFCNRIPAIREAMAEGL